MLGRYDTKSAFGSTRFVNEGTIRGDVNDNQV